MDDLTAFVAARNDADEQWAKDLIAHGPGDIGGQLGIAQRMLREVEAKRAIMELHQPNALGCCLTCMTERSYDPQDMMADTWPCETARAVVAVHSDHPGYQREWAL